MAEQKFLDLKGLEALVKKLYDRGFKGLGLSKNDFTDALKSKLEALTSPEDLSALQGRVSALEALVEADSDAAINKFNEIVAFLAGIEDTSTMAGIVSGIEGKITTAQNTANAAKGLAETAVQQEAGKGLSSNDFDDSCKTNLAKVTKNLEGFGDTDSVSAKISALETSVGDIKAITTEEIEATIAK